MRLFNTAGSPRTVTVNGRVIRFAPKSWSEELTPTDIGSGQIQQLLRKGVLIVDPLSQLPVEVTAKQPAVEAPAVVGKTVVETLEVPVVADIIGEGPTDSPRSSRLAKK